MDTVILKTVDSAQLDLSVPGLNDVRSEEGRAQRAYKDVVGVVTIGYGETKGVKLGDFWTTEQCELALVKALRTRYLPAVRKALPRATQPQFDAGYGFHYNTGAISKASWPKALMRGDMAGALAGIRAYCKGGGKVIPALVRRRAAECDMVEHGTYPAGARSGPLIFDGAKSTGKHGSALTAIPGDAPGQIQHEDAAVVATRGMMAKGLVDPGVKDVQVQLAALGFQVAPTGTFDDATEAAVQAFQKSHPNLTADGIVGPATRDTITREYDLWRKLKTQGSAAGTAATAAPAAKAIGFAIPTGLVVGIVVVAVLVVGAIVWHYRDEIMAFANRKLERAVP